MSQLRRLRKVWGVERGFTLTEVIAVVVIFGVVAAIAIPSWFNIVDSSRVDSATSQLASDLRLANARATNRLANWQVVLPPKGGSSYCYTVSKVGNPPPPCTSLPRNTQVDTTSAITITFSSDGSASVSPPSIIINGISSITVNSTANPSHSRTLKLVNATSVVDTRGRLP